MVIIFIKFSCLIRFYAYFRKSIFIACSCFILRGGRGPTGYHSWNCFQYVQNTAAGRRECGLNCGIGNTTDSNGNYHIRVNHSDSLRFSYLGRATQMFPVA